MTRERVPGRSVNCPRRGHHLTGGSDVGERTCFVDGCEKQPYRRGWCTMHYLRWRDHGDPHYKRPTAEELFWSRVEKTETCWLWMGYKCKLGYGRTWVRRDGTYTRVLAHRWAYEQLRGPIPLDALGVPLPLDHLCRNPSCVNPDHLEAVAQRVNNLRGESPYAKNARKTHCKQGHEFTRENTYVNPNRGGRGCRICLREMKRAYKKRKRGRG